MDLGEVLGALGVAEESTGTGDQESFLPAFLFPSRCARTERGHILHLCFWITFLGGKFVPLGHRHHICEQMKVFYLLSWRPFKYSMRLQAAASHVDYLPYAVSLGQTNFFFFKGFKFRWFFFQIALLLLPGENQPQQEQISWLEALISKLPDAVMLN